MCKFCERKQLGDNKWEMTHPVADKSVDFHGLKDFMGMDIGIYGSDTTEPYMWFSVWGKESIDDPDSIYLPIRYCPFCGKKLTDE